MAGRVYVGELTNSILYLDIQAKLAANLAFLGSLVTTASRQVSFEQFCLIAGNLALNIVERDLVSML